MPSVILAALLLAVPLAVPEKSGPREVIATTVGAVADVLLDESLSTAAKKADIERIVDARLDIMTLSKLVMARNWTRFDDDQKAEFAAEFKQHLMNTYFRNADAAEFDRIDVYADRDEGRNQWTVRTKVVSAEAPPLLMDYRLRLDDEAPDGGRWMVIDIIIENVSLLSNFRSQFKDIVARGGPAHAIELLREKNAAAAEAAAEQADAGSDED